MNLTVHTVSGKTYYQYIAIEIGVVTKITEKSVYLPNNELIKDFIFSAPRSYVDNITGVTQSGGIISYVNSFEDDSFHQIDAIDELVKSHIVGDEDKIDTLQITSQQQRLDLTVLHEKLKSIEIFDITGIGDNTLVLNAENILSLGEENLFIENGKTQLMVKGNEGDEVQLKDILPDGDDISSWVHQDGSVTVAGVQYDVYTQKDNAAELLVQQGVKTEIE